MENWLERTQMLIGKENLEKLSTSTVAVFGIGGVGSYALEALVRCNIGNIYLIDNDDVDITNINRQLIATCKVVKQSKVDLAKQRILDINPNCNIITFKEFYDDSKVDSLILNNYDYIVDAIDSISSKVSLIQNAKLKNIPIISSMGTGNKLDPTKFEVSDIYSTKVCPLAKIIRKELKSKNISSLKVVYSTEEPIKTNSRTPGSISFVPSVAGLILAGEVIKDLIN